MPKKNRAFPFGNFASLSNFHEIVKVLIIITIVLIGSIEARSEEYQDNFIKTSGMKFLLYGKEFKVSGVNNHYLTFGSEKEVLNVLDDAVKMGANVVRTFLQPVIGSLDGSVPTIWDFESTNEASNLGVKGSYLLYFNPQTKGPAINAEGFRKVDFLIAEARKRNLRLILSFLDFWDYTGGAQQMRAWYGSSDKNTFFFTDSRTKADYRTWVHYVVNRRNILTGAVYKDDPTIMAWELMNEPNASPDALRETWIAEMAAFVKAVAPKQLLTSGHGNINEKIADIYLKDIDFGAWHGYPKYYNQTVDDFRQQIVEYCAIGEKANKPVLLSEFGWARSNPNQVAVYDDWLKTLDAQPGCAGWIVWRLVSHQDHGNFPIDEYDQFDIRNDGSPMWSMMRAATQRTLHGPGME